MGWREMAILVLGLAGSGAYAQAPVPGETRGALLYADHCDACHTAQVHWREQQSVRDWRSLEAEVARWQAVARLDWGPAEVLAVARYLNERYYHFPAPAQGALPRREGSGG